MHHDWTSFLSARGAVIADGVVRDFGNPAVELQAAADGTIIADLSHTALLQVEGDDTLSFLQGQLTNDIKLLDGSCSHYTGYCSPKGRLLALFLAFAAQEKRFLQLDAGIAQSVLKRLRMYVLRSKVTITDVSEAVVRIGVSGAHAVDALQAQFGAFPAAPHAMLTLAHATLIKLPGSKPRFEVLADVAQAASIWEALAGRCTPAGIPAWEWLDIEAGIPRIEQATQEAFVPQMVNLDLLGGINFKKGCYTGQEIVARTHYLGKVKRRTHLAHCASAVSASAGDAVWTSDSSEAVGMVVSAAPAPQGGVDLLAELRLESLESGELRLGAADGPALTLRSLPYAPQD